MHIYGKEFPCEQNSGDVSQMVTESDYYQTCLFCNDYPSVNTRASGVDFIGSTQKIRINAIFLTESYQFKLHLPFHVPFHYIMRLCGQSA